ncbi:MAG: hypothetical protein R2762_30100, partial [Bryobacteraceae bacterium]
VSAQGAAAMTSPDAFAAAVPVLGKSLLGLAGAYLLRALSESGGLPFEAGAAAGILYAFAWLSFAARGAAEKRMESVMYSLTAVLVLAPLLWEAVLRFHAVTTPAAALALFGFTALGLTGSWRNNLTHVAWIATLAGLFTSAALLLATHDLVPFTFAIVAIAAVVEFSACFDHWLRERWLVALVANLSVCLTTWIATREMGVPEGYAPIVPVAVVGAQILLLAVYLGTAMARTLWRGLPFSGFEVLQCAFAFLLAIYGGLRVARTAPAIALWLPAITLIFGVACYLVSFAFLDRVGRRGRNFYVYSTFGLVLTMTGAGILLSPARYGALLSAGALAFLALAIRWERITLLWHGTVFLLLGLILSGTISSVVPLLIAEAAGLAALSGYAWAGAMGALAACLLLWRFPPTGESIWARTPVFVTGLASAVICAGILAGVLTGSIGASAATASTVRTAILLATVLFLAWGSQRWQRPDLAWLIYPLLAAAAYKFLFQDFRQQATIPLVASLALWGATMLLLPRILDRRRPTAQ